MCFEVRAPSSTSPPSPRRISNPLGVPNSSLNLTNATEAIQTQSTSQRGIGPQPNKYNLNLYQRGSKTLLQSTSTKEGYNKSRRVQQVVYLNHKPNPFLTNNDPIEQDRVIQLKWKSRCFWKSNNKEKLLGKPLVNDRKEDPKQYPKNLVFFEFSKTLENKTKMKSFKL